MSDITFILFIIIWISTVMLILGASVYKGTVDYISETEQAICEPKVMFPNGTKICK